MNICVTANELSLSHTQTKSCQNRTLVMHVPISNLHNKSDSTFSES